MKKCIILVGPPASGKSTYADDQFSDCMATVFVSTDDVIESICDDFNITYDESFKDLIGFAEKVFWKMIDQYSTDRYPYNIVVDRTNMSKKSRKRFIDLLKPRGYEFHAIVFPAPEKEEWERRLSSRVGKSIPRDVIESMLKNFEMPTEDEGFSSVVVYEGDE